jgi:hypothetical protein
MVGEGQTQTTAPQTLADLQAMSTAEFRQVDRYQYRGSVSQKYVLKDIIRLASRELSWQGRQNANSLRDFWYNPTKPILEKAFPGYKGGPGTSGWNRGMSKRLSSVLSDLVKSGEITYRSLNILDASRDRSLHPDSLESDKIIFVEKSAAYRKLKPLEEVYDVSLVEGSGWQATALIEDMIHELNPDEGPFHVWILTDYDPTGFQIAEDFASRAEIFGLDIVNAGSAEDLRIGVWPSQLDADTIRTQAFTVSGSDDATQEWQREYGIGDDGQFGIELEAIGGDLTGKAQALRRLVVQEIRDDKRVEGGHVRDGASATEAVGWQDAEQELREINENLREE